MKTKADEEFERLLRENNLTELAVHSGLLSPIETVLSKIITTDPVMLELKDKIRKLALPSVNIPVLIWGETGTGKELIAQALAVGRGGPFIPVNCGGIPDTLIESEFFGCVKGSFTGAGDRKGFIEEAEGGTLFLDEIGEMPLLLQSKLLRFLQSKHFRRVGETKERRANVRIVSATNCKALKEDKSFRKDLYYRLAGTILYVPPLSSRIEDCSLIIDKFAKPTVAQRLKERALNRTFDGNIRELLNLIEEENVFNS